MIYRDRIGLSLIFLGGVAGALARFGLTQALGHMTPHIAWGTLVANLFGACALGFLAAFLLGEPGSAPTQTNQRRYFLCGTGFMGAFTTYSAFVNEFVGESFSFLTSNAPQGVGSAGIGSAGIGSAGVGILYAGGSLICGLLVAGMGFYLGTRLRKAHNQGESSCS